MKLRLLKSSLSQRIDPNLLDLHVISDSYEADSPVPPYRHLGTSILANSAQRPFAFSVMFWLQQ